MRNKKIKLLYIAILATFSVNMASAASTKVEQNASTSQEKSAYKGSEADKKSINFLSESVNPATRTFNMSLPIVTLQGYISQTINISFNAYSQNGMLGLPDGWQYNIDYIVPGKSVTIDGNAYSMDFNWSDNENYKSGLRYMNQHGIKFSEGNTNQKLPDFVNNDLRTYRYILALPDGSKEYFDATGKLLIKADRFNNYISFYYTNPQIGVTGNRLDYIIDSLGQKYQFDYKSNAIMLTLVDSQGVMHRQTLNYSPDMGSGSYLTSYVDALGKITSLDYQTINNIRMVSKIDYPTGLETQISYENLPYYVLNNATHQKVRQYLNVVQSLKHVDANTKKLIYAQYYEGVSDRNYTGYPSYALSSNGNDNLMDSNSSSFSYGVLSYQSGNNPVTGQLEKHQVRVLYDAMSRPKESDIYLASDTQNPISKTLYTYPDTKNYHARTVNYSQPIETDHYLKLSANNTYRLMAKEINSYDDYGNKISVENYEYDPLSKSLVQVEKSTTNYDYHYNLPVKTVTQSYNPLTNSYDVKEVDNSLSSDNKNIVQQATYYNSAPWKLERMSYDSHGLESSTVLSWLGDVKHNGIKSVTTKTNYSFDPETKKLTVLTTDANGGVSKKVMDSITGVTLSETTAMGYTTNYTYDQDGREVSQKLPDGSIIKTEYLDNLNDANTVIRTTPMGYKSKTVYDVSGREVADYATTDPDDSSKYVLQGTKAYDAFGNEVKDTDKFGNVTTTQYNSLKLPIAKTDQNNNKTTISYDYANLSASSAVNGDLTTRVLYNFEQKPLISIHYPDPNNVRGNDYALAQQNLYDGAGNTVKTINYQVSTAALPVALGDSKKVLNVQETSYDADGKVSLAKMQQDGVTESISFERDLSGHSMLATKDIDNGGNRYSTQRDKFAYDAMGSLISDTDFGTVTESDGSSHAGVIKFAYDKDGNMIAKTRRDGTVIHDVYDNVGNKVKEYWQDKMGKTHTITYQYDQDANLIQSTLDGAVMKMSYDLAGNQTSKSYPDGKVSTTHYNAQGLITSLTDVNGQTTNFVYDKQGRLTQASAGDNKVTYSYGDDDNGIHGAAVTKTVVGQYVEKTHIDGLGNAVELVRTTPDGSSLLDITRRFNALGMLTEITSTSGLSPNDLNLNQIKDYTYDGLNQLTKEATYANTSTSGNKQALITSTTYSYDGNGNILTKDEDGNITTYKYNNMDQLLSMVNNGKTYNFTYNVNGDEINDGNGTQYQYNELSQLIGVQKDQQNMKVAYSYYPDGLRATRQVDESNQNPLENTYYYRDSDISAIDDDNDKNKNISYLMIGKDRIAALSNT
ncbi:RHS repeat domain-containing protein [Facilibium subflavum]|uniref:RHS repeat domain-containing protein n=1 Tax=Facilibium subflavum TaxID=2219058 RepID=UPI0013C3053F|nr:RHS repeat protein [Facilibium subflavum]